MWIIGVIFSVLAIVAGILYLRRLRALGARKRFRVDDDIVREIEESGRVEVDEPLDMEDIRDEEERFWRDQPWEEPEQW